MLAALDAATDQLKLARELTANPTDGRIKLYVISRAVRLRREQAELFTDGGYEPVGVSGEKAECVFAFLRVHGSRAVLVAVPRLVTKLAPPDGPPDWGDTRLDLPDGWAGRPWKDVFTGRAVTQASDAAELFADFPVACLVISQVMP
jgi:(1->4)-alpha-D-glucan 1-alpha-D-glucosylmutase